MLILPPFKVGDSATLYAPRELTCRVEKPDGSSYVLLDRLGKDVRIPLDAPGTWRYEFSDGSAGEIVVLDTTTPSVVP